MAEKVATGALKSVSIPSTSSGTCSERKRGISARKSAALNGQYFEYQVPNARRGRRGAAPLSVRRSLSPRG